MKFTKPTEKQKLNEAHEHFGLKKKKGKHLDWWDRVKISIYEDETKGEYEIVEPKQIDNGKPLTGNKTLTKTAN